LALFFGANEHGQPDDRGERGGLGGTVYYQTLDQINFHPRGGVQPAATECFYEYIDAAPERPEAKYHFVLAALGSHSVRRDDNRPLSYPLDEDLL